MMSLRDARYLYLCLRSGSWRHNVLEFHPSDLESDDAFFHAVKQRYTQSRGLMSRWLGWASWWRYDHCEFFSVSIHPMVRQIHGYQVKFVNEVDCKK
jgi:hypothetical protein